MSRWESNEHPNPTSWRRYAVPRYAGVRRIPPMSSWLRVCLCVGSPPNAPPEYPVCSDLGTCGLGRYPPGCNVPFTIQQYHSTILPSAVGMLALHSEVRRAPRR